MDKKIKGNFSDFMQALMDFEAFVVVDDFVGMFGKEKAAGLWQEFKGKCSSNTTIFYRILDTLERKQFNEYLEKSRWLENDRARRE